MGNSLKGCRFCSKRADNSITILLAGLDNAGKTKTVGLLVGNHTTDSETPTVGFQPTQLKYCGRVVHLHDVGGSDQFRRAWRHYYADAYGLIFVVDSADKERLQECSQVLEEVLAHPHISGKPVLILANKQDLKGAMDDLDIVERLNIETIVNRYKCPTRVESYTAMISKSKNINSHIDSGLKKGYEWLLNYIIHKYDELTLRVKNDMSDSKSTELDENHVTEIEMSGFENPNYKIDITQEDIGSEDGIITVKQATSEIIEKNGDIKLSPLFGRKNEINDAKEKSIELEARVQMRKLSPISKHRVFTASSIEGSKIPTNNANEIFAQQLKSFKSQDSLNENIRQSQIDVRSSSSKSKFTEISLSDNMDNGTNTKLELNRKVLPPIKGFVPKDVLSPKKVIGSPSHKTDFISSDRPKSASESIKKQLENVNDSNSTKKFMIKGLRNHRTTPEDSTSLFSYDPNISEESKSFSENPQNGATLRVDAI